MTRTNGIRGLAEQSVSYAAEQVQNVASQAAGSGVAKALMRTAELAGLPDTRLGRATTSALRFTTAKLESLNPKALANASSTRGSPISRDPLEAIADELDRKTLTSFARVSKLFAEIAGGAVRDLTFRTPEGLREGMAWLNDESRARFRDRGIRSLTLTHGQFDANDLGTIPDWIRASLQTLVLERPLTEAGWPALNNFPRLREVRMEESGGYNAADLARLPKSLTRLHLRMPATPEALGELGHFGSLRRVDVTLAPGANLEDVLAQFHATKPSVEIAGEAIKAPLHGVEIESVTYPKDQSFDESDLAKLPTSLKALSLPRAVRLSADGLRHLEGIRLRSLEINQAPNLSGKTLKALLRHPTLRHIRSAASNLNANDAKEIAASPRLNEVELPYNDRIGDEGVHALIANTRIQVLDIGRCGASDRLVLSLDKAPPPHIKSLNLMA